MSIVYTESFGAFKKSTAPDLWDTGVGQGNEARDQSRLALQRAGYGVQVSANAAKDTSGGLIVRNDPVYPERYALVHSSDVTPGVANQYSASLRKRLPVTDKQIIVGFSVYIPAEYVPNSNNSTVPVLRVNATPQADASWWQQGITPLNAAKECFRVCNDLSLRWGTDATQSSKKLAVGAVNYLELRISSGDVSVWIDDVFVMQKIVSLIPETVAVCFENNLNAGVGGTQLSGNPGRWALGNMYYMFNDGVGNSSRLGPSTRIIAMRPDEDIHAGFNRPASAASNAAVAGQDLVDSPPLQLQSTTVGEFDTYTSNNTQAKDAIKTMALVHAVCTKTLAANLEPDVHRVKPYVKSHTGAGGEGADNKPRDFSILNSPTSRNILCAGIRPTDNAIVIAGDGEMCYISGPNGDTSTWTRVSDTGGTPSFTGMYIRADGGIILTRKTGTGLNGVLCFIAPGTTNLQVGATAITDPGTVVGGIILSPDGTTARAFLGGKAQSTLFNHSATSAVLNGGAPQNGTWTLGSVTASGTSPAAGGWAQWASKADNSMHIGLTDQQSDSVYQITQANGGQIISRATGDAGIAYRAVGWDGTAFLIGANSQGGGNGAPVIRRSLDGVAWSQITQIGNVNAGANQILRGVVSNRANQQSMFFGDVGTVILTVDGINWRQAPRVTLNSLNCGVVTANGDFVLFGANGFMMRYTAQGADTELLPLAGYTMAFGAAVLNPATGTTWTTQQAADADFGVRLTS